MKAEFGKAWAPVRVTIGTHTYRSTVATYGGGVLSPVNQANPRGAGVDAGDTVTVTVEYDDAPRTVTVPDDLARALADASVADPWVRLSFPAASEAPGPAARAYGPGL